MLQLPRLALLPLLLAGCGALPPAAIGPVHPLAAAPAGSSATLALLETTDLHANVLSYDYYKLQAEPSIGLERTATLIAQRARNSRTICCLTTATPSRARRWPTTRHW